MLFKTQKFRWWRKLKIKTAGFTGKALFHSMFKVVAATLNTMCNPPLQVQSSRCHVEYNVQSSSSSYRLCAYQSKLRITNGTIFFKFGHYSFDRFARWCILFATIGLEFALGNTKRLAACEELYDIDALINGSSWYRGHQTY